MRRRINVAAICSSSNYISSKRAHIAFLQRTHELFISLLESGEIKITYTQIVTKVQPSFVIVKIFSRERKMSYEDFMRACPEFKIIKTIY